MKDKKNSEFMVEFKKAFGVLLRSYRESAGLSIEDTMVKLAVLKTKRIIRLENGIEVINNFDFIDLLQIYQIDMHDVNIRVEKIKQQLKEKGLAPDSTT